MRTRLFQIVHASEGSALLEMTVVFPLVLSLMIGAVDFGMALSDDATLGKSVRDAGRYISSLPSALFSGGCPSWVQQNATNLVIYGKFPVDTTIDSPLLSGWASALPDGSANNNVIVSCSVTGITISARAPFNTLMLPALINSASTLTLSAQHTEVPVND